MPRKSMLKERKMASSQKDAGLSVWKRLILIASMFLPGGSLAALVPSQAAYAQFGGSQSPVTCEAGRGGNGGVANGRSSGGNGLPGGGCVNGPRGGDAAPGGEGQSPGGSGGNVYY